MRVSPAQSVMHLTVIHPALPAVLIALVVFGLGALIARRSAFYRGLVDHEVSANRFHAIDGLRGYLALGVVLHHVVINFQYYQTGVWELTPSRLKEVASFVRTGSARLSGIAGAIKLPILSLAAWRSMLHPVSDWPAWNEADAGYTSSGNCRLSGARG
jgi:hypothetical protein